MSVSFLFLDVQFTLLSQISRTFTNVFYCFEEFFSECYPTWWNTPSVRQESRLSVVGKNDSYSGAVSICVFLPNMRHTNPGMGCWKLGTDPYWLPPIFLLDTGLTYVSTINSSVTLNNIIVGQVGRKCLFASWIGLCFGMGTISKGMQGCITIGAVENIGNGFC